MVERINAERSKAGLRPLKIAPRLTSTSRSYARHLLRTNRFGHGSSYRRAGFSSAGEILAQQRGRKSHPVKDAVRLWMHSSSHRNLIMRSGYRYIGASAATRGSGIRRTTVWVVHFGAH